MGTESGWYVHTARVVGIMVAIQLLLQGSKCRIGETTVNEKCTPCNKRGVTAAYAARTVRRYGGSTRGGAAIHSALLHLCENGGSVRAGDCLTE